jgi:hypothetical protein
MVTVHAFAVAGESNPPSQARPWPARIHAAKELRNRAASLDDIAKWTRRFLPVALPHELASLRSRDARMFLAILVAAHKRGHVAVEGSAEGIGRRFLRCTGRNVRNIRQKLVTEGLIFRCQQLGPNHAPPAGHPDAGKRRQGYEPNVYALTTRARQILAGVLRKVRWGGLGTFFRSTETLYSEKPPAQAASSERAPDSGASELERPVPRLLWSRGADEGKPCEASPVAGEHLAFCFAVRGWGHCTCPASREQSS